MGVVIDHKIRLQTAKRTPKNTTQATAGRLAIAPTPEGRNLLPHFLEGT